MVQLPVACSFDSDHAPPAPAKCLQAASDSHQPRDQARATVPACVQPGACSQAHDELPSVQPSQLRWGVVEDQGVRRQLEDATVICSPLAAAGNSLVPRTATRTSPSALFAVFDGHNGPHAAQFARHHILRLVLASAHYPHDMAAAMSEAFLAIDQQLYAASMSGQPDEGAGTTALAVVLWEGRLTLANAGDSRAVLSRLGRAIELTRDHKPHEPQERARIVSSGGFVCEQGRLGGELSVARALGDHHLPQLKQPPAAAGQGLPPSCPLTAEPEVTTHTLCPEDEFLLVGCDGLWDVLPSQRAVEIARASLRTHNDPQRCCEELVAEALRLHASDNVSLICCCFSADPPRRRVYACAKHLRGGSAARRPESGNSSPSPLAALLGSCEDGDAA